MKLIFLDIDGVLNSDVYMETPFYQDEVKSHGINDYKSYAVVLRAHHTHLDPSAVQLLNQLVKDSGAEVILSSTWRLRYSLEEMNDMLKKRGATFQIIGTTPSIKRQGTKRGSEVSLFLSKLEEQPESFVILDDIDQFPHHRANFVRTPEKTGLTKEYVEKALKILNG